MPSPTERADKVRHLIHAWAAPNQAPGVILGHLPSGSLIVTSEDIAAGWRVLIPEQAETVRAFAKWTQHHSSCLRIASAGDCSCGLREQWALLAEVPGKDSDT